MSGGMLELAPTLGCSRVRRTAAPGEPQCEPRWRELERTACDHAVETQPKSGTACPKVVGSKPGSGTELHRARGVTLMARCGASRYRGQICSRRLLGFGATPCRLVSLIHTSAGPYDRARDVRNASDMKVNRMSLALAALGQRAAMASELAGFGRNFRAGMHSMVSENLAFKSWRL